MKINTMARCHTLDETRDLFKLTEKEQCDDERQWISYFCPFINYRSLEECLTSRSSPGLASIRQELEKIITRLHCSQTCEAHLKTEVSRLREKQVVLNDLISKILCECCAS